MNKKFIVIVFALSSGTAFGQAAPLRTIETVIKGVNVKVGELRQKLQQCRDAGQDISMPDASLAVAELSVRFAQQDAAVSTRRQSAVRAMRYVDSMLDDALTEASRVIAGQSSYPSVPRWNVIGLDVREGRFWSHNTPVFLTGFNWNAGMARDEPQMMKRLGVNLVDGMLRGSVDASGQLNDNSYNGSDKPYMEQMERDNFAVDAMLSLSPPDWLYAQHPDLKSHGYGHYTHYAIDHPAFTKYRKETLNRLLPLFARHKALLAIDLMNEPAYQGTSSHTFANWRVWLKEKYGSIANVNEAWGTGFVSFDAVDSFPTQPTERKHEWQRAAVDWDKPGARGMHYDWCAFNKHRVTTYFQSANDQIRHHVPGVATHVKTMLGGYLTGGTEQRGWPMQVSYNTYGIDLPAISEMCGLNGGDDSFADLSSVEAPNRYFGSSPYIAGWLNSGLSADLMKSIARDKPFYDSEFHVVEQVDATEIDGSPGDHMKLALWHTHLHGMSANLLWYWGRNVDGAVGKQGQHWFEGSLLDQPWLLNAYSRESLNLRRFVPQVSAFARQPRKVRVLYSEASAIQDVGAIDVLRDTYEAMNFLGLHVGFVTERQLADDWLTKNGEQTRLVIVPNSTYVTDETVQRLQQIAAAGIAVRVIGKESLRKTPVGQPRDAQSMATFETIELGTPQEYHGQISQWLEQADIQRELVALDKRGVPAWGVETRTARIGDQRLAYLINLLRTPMAVKLQWTAGDAKFRDLNTGHALSSSITLQPREIVFGTY